MVARKLLLYFAFELLEEGLVGWLGAVVVIEEAAVGFHFEGGCVGYVVIFPRIGFVQDGVLTVMFLFLMVFDNLDGGVV